MLRRLDAIRWEWVELFTGYGYVKGRPNMQLLNTDATVVSSGAPEQEEVEWHCVIDELPEDGARVEVMLERTHEIRMACRGHYQSTGAWFDSETHTPIYETIVCWKEHS